MHCILPMDSSCIASFPVPSLPLLPAEIQNQILTQLSYPDLLCLKLSSSYFYYTIETTVHDRVDWLLDRTQRSLPIPQESKCLLGSDLEFCSNPEVDQILRRRWKHLECADYLGPCREVPGAKWCVGRLVEIEPRSSILRRIFHRCCIAGRDAGTRIYSLLPSTANIWFAGLGAVAAMLLLAP